MAQKVFESIYRAHRDYVYGFALRLTGFDPDAAEELTQESFYRAFVALPRFRGDCDVRTWLCQIMKHTFYKQLRKARTRQRAALRAGEADAQADPHAVFERESLYRAALAEIGRMKPKQRDVVVLRLFSRAVLRADRRRASYFGKLRQSDIPQSARSAAEKA